MRLRALFVAAVATLGALAPAAAAQQTVTGRAIVFDRGFDVIYWDSVNGARKIGRGLEPSLSSNGRFIAYLDRDGPAGLCNPIVLHDLKERRDLPLPGINTADCKNDPRVSGDGRFIVFSGDGTSAGDPNGIYLYDVANQRRIDLPAPVNSPSTEGSPSLSDDGRLLAFVSGRNTFDKVFLADISAVPSGGAATLVPLPGLPMDRNDSQRTAEISGDGNTIAYGYSFVTAGKVGFYDRTTSTNSTPAALAQPGETFQPGINSAGNLIVVARTPADSSTSEPHLFDRGSGTLTRLSALDSSISEDELDIADPVQLVDEGDAPIVSDGVTVVRDPLPDPKINKLFKRFDETTDVGKGPGGSLVPLAACTIVGTPGKDRVKGTKGNDVICGLGGNDVLNGAGGKDIIDGARGADRLSGAGGKDMLIGLAGNDRENGGAGKDRIGGGAGTDRVTGGKGGDRMHGGSGKDRLKARDRTRDTVNGGKGRDQATADGTGLGVRRADRIRRVELLG